VRRAERPPDRSGEDPDSDHAERPQILEHGVDEVVFQRSLLEPVAVDQKRRIERTESLGAELVPCAAARNREVGPAVAHGADRGRLVARPVVGAVHHADAQGTMRQSRHLFVERRDLLPAAEWVEDREDPRVRRAVSSNPVGAAAHAAGKRSDSECSNEQ
jgi:hypothetical protein